ncbi:hypothetical protein GJ496_005968 [Pomphorhynchus laevis]|nr:hypothetical protein GJ496_005968 [Pomphorhynchus laevis]
MSSRRHQGQPQNVRYLPISQDENKENMKTTKKDDGKNRHMGLFSGISLIVGSVIGSGIFVSPKEVILSAGSLGLSLIIWIAGGLVCIPGAICYAELGCLIPSSGGDYTYIKEAFGDLMGFLRVWSEVIVTRPCILGVNALTVFEYLLYPYMGSCISRLGLKFLACIGVLSITALNAFSLRGPVIFQNIGTIGKVSALFVIIITGFVQMAKGRTSQFSNLFEGTENRPIRVAVAIHAGLFPYTGWNYLNNAVEELKNPARNLPIAIFVSLVFCTIVYTLTFASYFTALSISQVKTVPATAVSYIELIYSPLRYVLPLFVALSALGGLNGNLFTISRMFFVAGRDGMAPSITATKHLHFNTPIVPAVFEGLLGCMYVCVGDIEQLLKYLSFTYWLVCLFAVISLFVLRKKYKLPEGVEGVNAGKICPLIFIFVILVLNFISIAGSRKESKDFFIGMGIILSGVPVYLLFIAWRKPESLQSKLKNFTIVMQKALNCYPEPMKTWE